MRGGGLWLPIAALVVLGVIIIALIPSRPGVQEQPPGRNDVVPDVVRLSEPVAYCPPVAQSIPHGRVQVLLDSSGSMMGVRQPVAGALRWIEQGLSRLRDSALVFDELRLAQFDQRRGIVPSASFPALAAEYAPSGRTTLHDAINAAREYDLTFILTDGVAAAGSSSGSCAAGVDAACVARALRDAVHLEQTTAVPPQPGIWIIPLWVRHSGVFFSEKPAATADFDSAASLQKLHDELGQDVSISNARADAEGNLVFDYTGPRGILLIVLARSDDVGRRSVGALRDRMAENGVAAVTSIRQATRPLSAFPPVELYPGYVPRLEWVTFEASDKAMSGTLDAAFVNDRRIALECAAGQRNEGEFVLDGKWPKPGGRCVGIYQLPAFEFEFVARNARDDTSAATFMASSTHGTESDRERFVLTLQCGEGDQRPCASDPVTVTWTAQSRYDYSRDAEAKASGGAAIISAIATSDLVVQPHRIYGLESLVSIFFDEVRQDRRRVPLADLELCHGRAEQP